MPLLQLLFFFQAEDGIRDLTVTGVQTCALPISMPATTQKPDTGEEAEVHTIVEMASRGDCPGVIAAADRYLARHPRSSHRPTILWHQAECYRLMLHSGQ